MVDPLRGETAITGATDPVGKAYSHALAERKIDLILMDSNKKDLEELAADIEFKHQVHTFIVVADFGNDSEDNYFNIEQEIFTKEIGILINNASAAYPYPEYFLDVPNMRKVYTRIINTNVNSLTFMTETLLPKMLIREKGVIVNVSSTTGEIPSPLLSVYGASKAYVEKFSMDLAQECKDTGVFIQCLLPGYIVTNAKKPLPVTWIAPRPEVFVEHSLRTIGVEHNTSGYFAHTFMMGVFNKLKWIAPQLAPWIILHGLLYLRYRTGHF